MGRQAYPQYKNAPDLHLERHRSQSHETLLKRFASPTRGMPALLLSFISVFSQVQLSELCYTWVQYVYTEGQLLPQKSRASERRNLPYQGSNISRLIPEGQKDELPKILQVGKTT
jgi:hypothetical protein